MSSQPFVNPLITYRRKLNLSQDEVAYIFGSSSGVRVSQYEHSKRTPSLRGLWLEKLGWEIGEKVEVQASEEEIIIKRINLPESKKTPEPEKETNMYPDDC